MNLFRLSLGLGGAGLLAVGLSSCLNAPDYSSTPEITYDHYELKRLNDAHGQRDSLALTIRYQDGDGDLGLTSDEVSNKTGKYYGTRYVNNFFVTPYVKVGGTFVSLASSGRFGTLLKEDAYYSRFGHITASTDARSLPIKGTLVWSYSFFPGSPFFNPEEVQFKISIADRALHDSNTLMTPNISFPQ